MKQECIPVGCVPAARRPYSGVCVPGGVSAWSGGGLPGPGGVLPVQGGSPSWAGVLPVQGGFSLPGDPPMDRITDTCKNITLATTLLRPVTIWNVSNATQNNWYLNDIFAGLLESANSSNLTACNLFKDFGGEKSGFYDN